MIQKQLAQGTPAYRKLSKKLMARIARDFDKKFFIGDISISDDEYQILKDYSSNMVKSMLRNGCGVLDSPQLVVTLVQIGIRQYDGNYWNHVAQELNGGADHRSRTFISDTLMNTLRAHGKYILSESERVQTILFHGFVSDYYSKGLFELLFQYYVRDLERDIYRNDDQQMHALMETLAMKASLGEKDSEAFTDNFMVKGSRAYKLRHHTLSAISAKPRHSKTRLRRLLRLIDNAFWNGKVPKRPSSRLTILFKQWVEESPSYQQEYSRYMLGEIANRGKKHFASPYLFADIDWPRFELRLPAQIIRESDIGKAVWEVTTSQRTIRVPVDHSDVLTGHKTFDTQYPLFSDELFGTIKCQLLWSGISVKRFPNIPASTVRFFDMEGDYAPRLFRIPMCAYTSPLHKLTSPALKNCVPAGQLMRWDFSFERGDVVILPNGESMVVGDRFVVGLIPRNRIPEVTYLDQKHLGAPVYSLIPDLIIKVPSEAFDGTIISVNETRFKLSNIVHTKFDVSGHKQECAVLVPLNEIKACKNNALNSVYVSIPGDAHTQTYDFVYINGFAAHFDGSPYVFEERGTVVFPPHIHVTCEDVDKLQGENGFCFDLTTGISKLLLTVQRNMCLELHIPAVSWSLDNENWNYEPAGELWYSEFNRIKAIYVRSPISKIFLSTDSDIADDEDDEMCFVPAEPLGDDKYVIDMQPFKKWLTRDIMKHKINLRIGSEEYRFASVFTRSFVVSCDIKADYDTSTLTCKCDVIGMSDYYIDIVHKLSGKIIADKAPLKDGLWETIDPLRSGIYSSEVFEKEIDEDNGESVFWSIHAMEKELINKNDFSGKYLHVRKFKPSRMSNLFTHFSHEYWIVDLTRIDAHTYRGKLLDNGVDSEMDVQVTFPNTDELRYFTIAFWDDYEEMYIDFMFDAEHGKLVKDEIDGLRPSERYRRYRVLFEDDYIYFGILNDTLPTTISS